MPDSDEAEVIRIANDIKRYLEDHPYAADTLDGITKWWLLRQRFEESVSLVRQALDYLVSESVVKRKTNPGGDQVYFKVKGSVANSMSNRKNPRVTLFYAAKA